MGATNSKKQFELTVKKKFPSRVVSAAQKGCLKVTYKSEYPAPSNEFMGVDFNQELEMTGDLELKYGAHDSCDGNTDGNIKVDFKYKTRTHLPDVKTRSKENGTTKSVWQTKMPLHGKIVLQMLYQ